MWTESWKLTTEEFSSSSSWLWWYTRWRLGTLAAKKALEIFGFLFKLNQSIFFSNESPSTLSLSIQVYMKIETERSCFPVRFSPEFQTLYIAHSIKVALGIGKLLFGGHSSKALHCLICPITKATFFDLAVYHFLTGKVPLSDTLLSWTRNSKAQDSWFYRQKFPRFRNPACFTRLTENYCESN